jgi:hypothetical protein
MNALDVRRRRHCTCDRRIAYAETMPSRPTQESSDVRARIVRLTATTGAICAAALLAGVAIAAQAGAAGTFSISEKSFHCITDMTRIRHFYVDNLAGDLEGTAKVAQSATGGIYPVGSVVQLVPTEVMVKREKGFNAATRDWEFFELDVSKDGSKIRKRGFAEVVNRFGGNCFSCHVKARPEWDFICDNSHGCDPIPITRSMSGALQRTDPRCKNQAPVSAEDAAALAQLGEIVKALTADKPGKP